MDVKLGTDSGNWERMDRCRHTCSDAHSLRVFWGLDGGMQMLVLDM